jgi:antitoxin (DNA-binding transcriptional repressor) of toxin-antitoxin stability system
LAHINPKFQEFAMNPRRAPQGIRGRHRADQRANVSRNTSPTGPATTLPGPEQTKALSMPGDDRLRLHDDERASPVRPCARQPHPEEAVQPRQAHSRPARALQHAELVPQREQHDVQSGTCPQRIADGLDERKEDDVMARSVSRSHDNINTDNKYGVLGRDRRKFTDEELKLHRDRRMTTVRERPDVLVHTEVNKNGEIAKLKARLTEYLRAVRRGETIALFDRETHVAEIVPVRAVNTLRVRKPTADTAPPNRGSLPKPSMSKIDVVQVLLETRQSHR